MPEISPTVSIAVKVETVEVTSELSKSKEIQALKVAPEVVVAPEEVAGA